MIKGLVKLILILNSNQKPWQIAGAAAMGFFLALIPVGNLLWVILFLFFMLLRVNKAILLLFLFLFRLAYSLYDPLLEPVGYFILTLPSLNSLWVVLYDLPFMPFTSFNDSLVMGGLIMGIVLFIPVMFLFRLLVNLYRKKLIPLWCNSKIYKKLKTLTWFKKLVSLFSASSRVLKVRRS